MIQVPVVPLLPSLTVVHEIELPGVPSSPLKTDQGVSYFNAPGALAFDVDTVTADAGQTNAAFRFAVVGETSAPAAKMFVSQRGTRGCPAPTSRRA